MPILGLGLIGVLESIFGSLGGLFLGDLFLDGLFVGCLFWVGAGGMFFGACVHRYFLFLGAILTCPWQPVIDRFH